jgi:MoaA/NifB/PqqE/SkfB family radical SAM enzyme
MFKVTSRWAHQDSIRVEWNLGKRCNYDCSYCPESIHDNSSPHTDIEILKATVDRLVALGKPIRLSFTGGEPTVHPKFNELVKYANHKNIKWVSVTTNGTLPFEFYAMLPVDQYVFSLHLEYDWRRVWDTVLKVSSRSNIKVIAQIMAHHNHMDAVLQLRARCLQEEIPSTVRRIRWTEGDHDLFDDMRYHPDDLKWIKEQEATIQGNCVIDDSKIMHANDVIKLHLNKYKDWSCNAGIESLMINWDGDVHRATCRVGGSLGNIYEGSFIVPSEPVTCNRNFCTCAADIPLTKYTSINIVANNTQ